MARIAEEEIERLKRKVSLERLAEARRVQLISPCGGTAARRASSSRVASP